MDVGYGSPSLNPKPPKTRNTSFCGTCSYDLHNISINPQFGNLAEVDEDFRLSCLQCNETFVVLGGERRSSLYNNNRDRNFLKVCR